MIQSCVYGKDVVMDVERHADHSDVDLCLKSGKGPQSDFKTGAYTLLVAAQ
jgi:hypothetical protein